MSAQATKEWKLVATSLPVSPRPRVPASSLCPRSPRQAFRGAILLEVLISLGLLVFGLGIVGLRVVTALDTSQRIDRWTRGVVLADIKLSELEAGAVRFKPTDDELKGYFGMDYPGYSWRIHVEQTDTDELYMLTLEIGYNGNPQVIEQQKNNPQFELDIEDPGTLIVREVHRLMVIPADLDLNRDFGIDIEAMMAGDTSGLGGGGGAGGGGEGQGGGAGGDLGGEASDIFNLVMEFLTNHPEILNDNGGIDLNAVADLPAEDFQLAMEILNQFVGRGTDFGSLQDQLDEGLDEAQAGRGQNGGNNRGGFGGNTGGGNTGGGDPANAGGPGGGRGGRGGDAGGGPGGRGGQGPPGGDRNGGPPGGDRNGGPPGGGRDFGAGRDRDTNDRGGNDANVNDAGGNNRNTRDRNTRDRDTNDRNTNDGGPNNRREQERNADNENDAADDRNTGNPRERLRRDRENRGGTGR